MSESYVLGRGKFYVDGEYVGNTSRVTFDWDDDKLVLKVCMEDMRKARPLFFGGPKSVSVEYRSANPVGMDTSFKYSKVSMSFAPYDLKTDVWMTIQATFEIGSE